MADSIDKFGFTKQWLGIINDQAEQEKLVAKENAMKQAIAEAKRKAKQERKPYEAPKPPVSRASLVIGRGIAIIYGGVVVLLAMTGAALGLFVSLGLPSPLTAAIISGCISAYINVTAFWKSAPQLIDDIFVTRIFFKKITDDKQQQEFISWYRGIALILVSFLFASIAAGVAITSEMYAMTMAGGALEALGIGTLFGMSGVLVPILLCVGFMTYWVLYSDASSKILRETNFMTNLKQKFRYLFCIDTDKSLLLPEENPDKAWLRVRAFIRLVIFLAVVAAIIFATWGFGVAGVGLMLGLLQVGGGLTPAILANTILPLVATSVMGLWAASVNFKVITLIVLGFKYAANQYMWPIADIESAGTRRFLALLFTVIPILPVVFVLRGLWGFAKAEGRYAVEGLKEYARTNKEGPGFNFGSVYESARLKTAYKPWSGIGNITYNLVMGTRNIIGNLAIGIMSSPLLLDALPPIRWFVTSPLAGINKFLGCNRKLLAAVNAFNNAALIGGGEGKDMQILGTVIPGNAVKSVKVSGGGMTSAGFGYASVTSDELFSKQSKAATHAPVLHQHPHKNSVHSDLKVTNPQALIAEAKRCVSAAHVAGKKMIIDGKNKALVREAFKVCLYNGIAFKEPETETGIAALAEARASEMGAEYKLQHNPSIHAKQKT